MLNLKETFIFFLIASFLCCCEKVVEDTIKSAESLLSLAIGRQTLSRFSDSDFAFPSIVSAYLPLPFITSGYCTPKKFVIDSVSELFNNLGDLECIFAAGITPTAVGLGYNYGTLLTAANTAWPATVAPIAYQGDYVVRTRCNDAIVNLGTLHVAHLNLGTAKWSIGPLDGPMAAGEYYNAKDNLIMDFRFDVNLNCHVEDPNFPVNGKGFLPFRNAIPPVNSFVDIGRVVGRDATDGGIIFLNKAMASDPVRGYATVLYYAIKNFDPAVNPDLISGTPITVTEPFTYSREGIRAPLERLGTVFDITVLQKAVEIRDAIFNPGARDTATVESTNSQLPFTNWLSTVLRRIADISREEATALVTQFLPSFVQTLESTADEEKELKNIVSIIADALMMTKATPENLQQSLLTHNYTTEEPNDSVTIDGRNELDVSTTKQTSLRKR